MRKRIEPESRVWIEAPAAFDFATGGASPEKARESFVLLHGFNESGERMLSRLGPSLPATAAIIAPNGSFAMPRRTEQGFKLGFTWYLYDPASQQYYVDMRVALDFLLRGLERTGYSRLPLTIIGFSQGGYLAPFLGARLPQTRQVIGIDCEYLVDELSFPLLFRVDAVHGTQDEIIPIAEARASHERLVSKGVSGTFSAVEGSAHRIDGPTALAVERTIRHARS